MKQINNTDLTDKKRKFLHKELCYKVLGCVFDVRNMYGSGQKELVYQNAFTEILEREKIDFRREVNINIISPQTGNKMGNYRLDFVIDDKLIIETKAITYMLKKIENQLYSYLRSTPFEVGYLVNFGSTNLYIKRIILTNDRKPYFNKIKYLFNL